MKVIDLLNKIANNEKPPQRFKYDGIIWNYKEGINRYISEDDSYCLGGFDFEDLNREIEVL